MNETLIKEIVKYKIKTAKAIVNSMPPKAAQEIRGLARSIMEGIEEGCEHEKEEKNSKPNTIHCIDIE